MADRLSEQGLSGMVQPVWEMWRHNEVERLKLRAQIEALDG
jgi:hypothetical protein